MRNLPVLIMVSLGQKSLRISLPHWLCKMREGRPHQWRIDLDQRDAGTRRKLRLAGVHVQHVHVVRGVQQQVQQVVHPRGLPHALAAGERHANSLCGGVRER